MVKKGKRKNPGVGIDFKRAKYKVGRKLAPAKNVTDTTVKSASISLAQQSIAVDRTGEALTERKLTLKETLAQCSHYSEKVRRDALEGLAQLASSDPSSVRRAAAQVMDATIGRLSDSDAGVRSTLLSTLRAALFPALGPRALSPFLPRLMAALSAALTQLSPAVRADALRALEVVARSTPAALGPSYLPALLRHFVALLSRSARGRSLSAGSLTALEQTLLSLETLLIRALECRQETPPICHDDIRGDASMVSHGQFCRMEFGPTLPSSETEILAVGWGASLDQADHVAKLLGSPAPAGADEARELFERLLDAWAECGVDLLAVEANELAARCATYICRCMSALLDRFGGLDMLAGQKELPDRVLQKVAPSLPVSRPTVPCSATMLEALTSLNVAGMSLLLKFLPQGLQTVRSKKQRVMRIDLSPWAAALLDWIKRALENDAVIGDEHPMELDSVAMQATTAAQLPPCVYQTLLDGVSSTLSLLPSSYRIEIIRAVGVLAGRSSEQGPVVGAVASFWEPYFASPGRSFYIPLEDGKPLIPFPAAIEWIKAIPRALWKLGRSQPERSTKLLSTLQQAIRLAPEGNPTQFVAVFADIHHQMLVLWGMLLPASAKKQKKKDSSENDEAPVPKKFVTGPLAALPLEAQEMAADTVAYITSPPPALLSTVAWVALTHVYPSQTAIRLIRNLQLQPEVYPARSKVADFLRQLLSGRLLVGGANEAKPRTSETLKRRGAVLNGTCAALSAQPDAVPMLHELLIPALTADGSWAAAQGALHAVLCLQRRLLVGRGGAELGAIMVVPDILISHLATATNQILEEDIVPLALQLVEAAPSLLRTLLLRCVEAPSSDAAASSKFLVVRLRLLLALLQRQALAPGLLRCKLEVQRGLERVHTEVESVHDANEHALVARQLLAQCDARTGILLGTL